MVHLFYKILVGVLLVFCVYSLKAQTTQFSQFYASPTNLGPSFAGLTQGSRISLNYRDQQDCLY